jgi:ABC-type transporter Mla subunit MlaD
VKFRGVPIGAVSAIEIAPDQRHVDVVEELDADKIERMGLAEHEGGLTGKTHFRIPADLRAQLGTQGITGVKFVAIDFFDPKMNPPPPLPFEPPETYIPAATSVMKTLEDTFTRAMDKLPELVDAIVAITNRVDRMIAELEEGEVTRNVAAAFRYADQVLASLARTMGSVEQAGLAGRAVTALDGLSQAVSKLSSILDRFEGEDGLLASLHRASDAVGSFGRGAGAATRELDQTLREVRAAAAGIRDLTDALERDPDMFVKGRAKAKTPAAGAPK